MDVGIEPGPCGHFGLANRAGDLTGSPTLAAHLGLEPARHLNRESDFESDVDTRHTSYARTATTLDRYEREGELELREVSVYMVTGSE